MENTEAPIQTEETTKVVEPVTEETSKINGEQPIIEEPSEEVTEKTGDEVPTTTTTITEETAKPIDEQENVTDTNLTVPPTCLSPGRANVPLKEVNESEKEEPVVHTNGTNGTENTNSKKRELEDEPHEETPNDNDERVVDQTKKIKTSEATDTPIIETPETEKNIIVNGNTAVEV
jgi:hypothetical protein